MQKMYPITRPEGGLPGSEEGETRRGEQEGGSEEGGARRESVLERAGSGEGGGRGEGGGGGGVRRRERGGGSEEGVATLGSKISCLGLRPISVSS